jgi:uncharacterized protein
LSLTPDSLPELSPLGHIPEPTPPPPTENPPWTGWHVTAIAVLTVVSIGFFLTILTYATHRFVDPNTPIIDIAKRPLLTVVAQTLAYLAILALMVAIARQSGSSFSASIRWIWPPNPFLFLASGVALAIGLQGVAHFVPMPKELPIDRFFQTPAEAWVLSLFGITFAPLIEELFFRGFLYPVLARRMGTVFAIVLTALGFGLIHAPQLGRAWGPVLVVFLVGLALTITRAVTKSVCPGLLMHAAYNFTLTSLLYVASGGFHHLDRLTQ